MYLGLGFRSSDRAHIMKTGHGAKPKNACNFP